MGSVFSSTHHLLFCGDSIALTDGGDIEAWAAIEDMNAKNAPLRFQKHHNSQNKSLSARCCNVYVFIMIWIIITLSGAAYFFRSLIVEDFNKVRSGGSHGDVAAAGNLRGADEPVSPQVESARVAVQPVQALPKHVEPKIGTPPPTVLTNATASTPKRPTELLKTKDMWKMKQVDQRAYLQSIHADKPPPSTKAADAFFKYIEDAAAGKDTSVCRLRGSILVSPV